LFYNVEELKNHLESQFAPEMTWNNYGTLWHIDHKTPLSWFKIQDENDEKLRIAWGLANLQPKTAIENLRKGNRYEEL